MKWFQVRVLVPAAGRQWSVKCGGENWAVPQPAARLSKALHCLGRDLKRLTCWHRLCYKMRIELIIDFTRAAAQSHGPALKDSIDTPSILHPQKHWIPSISIRNLPFPLFFHTSVVFILIKRLNKYVSIESSQIPFQIFPVFGLFSALASVLLQENLQPDWREHVCKNVSKYVHFGNNTRCLNQIMAEETFDVLVVGSCMTDMVRWVPFALPSCCRTLLCTLPQITAGLFWEGSVEYLADSGFRKLLRFLRWNSTGNGTTHLF